MKKVSIVIAFILFVFYSTTSVFAGAKEGQERKQNSPDSSRVSSHVRIDAAGTTRAMFNINANVSGSSAEEIARTFLQNNSTAFNIANIADNLRTEEILTVAGIAHVRFMQTYQGIPVFRGDVVVSLTAENRVSLVVNNFKNALRLASTTPSISDNGALQIARQRLNIRGKSTGKPDRTELMIYRDGEGSDHLAYKVSMTNEEPLGDWQVFVDAIDGSVLNIEDLFANEKVQGSGYVYLSDPLSAARKMYNNPGFTDNNDADSDSLSAYRSLVTLDSLTHDGGMYKLIGPYCSVTDVESPTDPPYIAATTPDGFTFTRSEQQFEAVNVYYHVSTAYKHLLDLGFSVPSLTQIRLDPHGFLGQDNSHYSPSGNWISWGEGGVDDAEDADVIWHEYGHAIMYNIIPNWGGGESGALGEGFGDYWAGSYSRSLNQWAPSDYPYNWVFNWDGHNTFWLGRTLNDARVYPFGSLEIHTAGQIWSAALMGIWDALGRDITDRLVIQSFYYLGSGTTGPDAAQAILQADRDLYGGQHLPTLVYWLGTVKHFIDPTVYLPTISHTPISETQNENGPYNIQATIVSQLGLNQQRVYLVWGRGEVFTDTTMMLSTGDPTMYEGSIPGNGEPGTIRYYIVAYDVIGESAISPADAPTTAYSFEIGQQSTSGVTTSNAGLPLEFALNQNYPNPFNPTTSISYTLPTAASVTLHVYNALGQIIATLVDQMESAGFHEIRWSGWNSSGAQVGSGTYFYKIEAQSIGKPDKFIQLRKMTLLK